MKTLKEFKKEILAILKQKFEELTESKVMKSLLNVAGDLLIQKGRAANIGDVREWKGRKFKKIAPNKWRPIYDSATRGAKQSIKMLAKKVVKAQSVDELLEIVMQNVNRFTDANGKTLDIVNELKNAVNDQKSKLNAGKTVIPKQTDKTPSPADENNGMEKDVKDLTDDEIQSELNSINKQDNRLFATKMRENKRYADLINEQKKRKEDAEKEIQDELKVTKIREDFKNPEKLGKWNGKIYGNEKYGYSIYVDNKKIEINSEEKKQLEDYAAKKAEDSKNAMKEKINTTIRNNIVDWIIRDIGATERNIDELNKFISILTEKNLPKKEVMATAKNQMKYARTERHGYSDAVIQSDYQSYIDNMSDNELKTLSDIAKNELEKIKTQKQKELDEKKSKEKAKKEYEHKLLTDENFRKEEEDKNRAEREKQRKQESRVEEIAGEGYWNGKVYGSARNGYSVYVANKKYTIPEKDYELFDLKKSFLEQIKDILRK